MWQRGAGLGSQKASPPFRILFAVGAIGAVGVCKFGFVPFSL
jgi:hypothetical protein